MARRALNQFCKKWKSIWNRIQHSLPANCDKVINRILERRLIFDGTVTNAVTIQLHQGQSCGDGRTRQTSIYIYRLCKGRCGTGAERAEHGIEASGEG